MFCISWVRQRGLDQTSKLLHSDWQQIKFKRQASEEATDRGKHKAKNKKKKRICDKFQQQTTGSSGNSLTANQKQFVKGRCEILKSLKCHLDV